LEGYERLSAALSAAELEQLAAQQALDTLYDNADLLSAQAARTLTSARDAARDAERYLDNLTSPAKQTDIEQARANKILSEDALEKAREDFEPYKNKPESNLTRAALQSRLAQIQEQYDAAVRLLNNLLAEVDEIDLAQAETALELANANLTEAQKNYDILQAGPDPDEVALAEARLKNAAAQLAAAQDALEDLELRAPFGGTLVVFEVKEGEFVTPGLPLITLADFSQWQVETIDLAESDVARLEPGMEAIITLDAFPDRTFAGRVIEIAQTAEDRRGDVTYPVTLTFDPGDTPVRWGMTAFVDIALP
jgi:multidrug resistance efflux pump